jgi:acyl transferase domain-containing protein
VLRHPWFSEPLITALQLAILAVFETWRILPHSVMGHSSGEIAAAYAAGCITEEDAIKVAFYRGEAAKRAWDGSLRPMGMMAVALDPPTVSKYLEGLGDSVHLACFNSPSSVTLSGICSALEEVQERLNQDNHFCRMLKVNLPYHSELAAVTTQTYERLLIDEASLTGSVNSRNVTMISTVTGKRLDRECDAAYWKSNMASPVLFTHALEELLSHKERPNILIEVGPSDTLKGPIMQIKDSLSQNDGPLKNALLQYHSALKMGDNPSHTLMNLSGKLYLAGYPIPMKHVNSFSRGNPRSSSPPLLIVDLPNYGWNHTANHWTESEASKYSLSRKFLPHELLGARVLDCSWHSPSWTKTLRLRDLSWLRDHRLGGEVIFPAAGYTAMAMEAVYQAEQAVNFPEEVLLDQLQYQMREVEFLKSLVLQEDGSPKMVLSLEPPARPDVWHRFRVSSLNQGVWQRHCEGFIRLLRKSATKGICMSICLP